MITRHLHQRMGYARDLAQGALTVLADSYGVGIYEPVGPELEVLRAEAQLLVRRIEKFLQHPVKNREVTHGQ